MKDRVKDNEHRISADLLPPPEGRMRRRITPP